MPVLCLQIGRMTPVPTELTVGQRDPDKQSGHSVCGKSSSVGTVTETALSEVFLSPLCDGATVPGLSSLLCPRLCISFAKKVFLA